MRFFINDYFFLSVIHREDGRFSCQVMQLLDQGLYPVSLVLLPNAVASIVHNCPMFTETSKVVDTLLEVSFFHEALVKEYHSIGFLYNPVE